MQKPLTAIVLDGNQRSALAAVRSLGNRKIHVSVAEKRPQSLAGSSRFCQSTLTYPDPADAPDDFCNWLEETNRRHQGSVIMPMTDLTTPIVLEAAHRLHSLRTALPSLESYKTVSDKYRLFKLARDAGIRVPETVVVCRANANDLGGHNFRYPVVIKPRQSSMRLPSGVIKRSVLYAKDATELARIVKEQLIDDTDELLLQEYVSGFGAGVFGIYRHGEPLFFFAHRRVREKPPSGGVSVVCESVPLHAEGLAAARRILDNLAWHGVAMVEFKIDEQGRTWLIEINARFWGSLQLAVDCGADFPWLAYQIAMDLPFDAPKHYEIGNQLRWWLGDLDNLYARLRNPQWTPTFWQKMKAIGEFTIPWRPGMRYEFLRWNDPKPAVTAFHQYFEALVDKGKSI